MYLSSNIIWGELTQMIKHKAGVRNEKPRRIRSKKSRENRDEDTRIILKCISEKYLVKL